MKIECTGVFLSHEKSNKWKSKGGMINENVSSLDEMVINQHKQCIWRDDLRETANGTKAIVCLAKGDPRRSEAPPLNPPLE